MALQPLISCICITRGKPLLLQRAINCFNSQSYERRELVVLYEVDDLNTHEYIKTLPVSDNYTIIPVQRNDLQRLGDLRNIAIQAAKGEYVCQWDDDDWYHSERLAIQYEKIKVNNAKGSILMHWIVFNSLEGKSYISNTRPWEGSLLCKKELLLKYRYENLSYGEDTQVINDILSHSDIHRIERMPHLYIYIYHGGNTWNYQHWSEIFSCGIPLAVDIDNIISQVVQIGHTAFDGSCWLTELADKHIGKWS